MDSKEQELRLRIKHLRQELFETEQKLLSLDIPIEAAPVVDYTLAEIFSMLDHEKKA